MSDNFSHKLIINNQIKRVLIGYLNPKDDIDKYNSDEYTCIKVDMHIDHYYILEESELVTNSSNINLIEASEYRYGTFENPRVAFSSSILPEEISILNKDIDEPVLFDNSRDLYYQIKISKIIDELEPSEVYFALCEYLEYKKNKEMSNLEYSKTKGFIAKR